MAECITKDQVIEWFRPYGHTDKGVPYYGLVTDIREMPAADAAPVVHGRWVLHYTAIGAPYTECSRCCTDIAAPMVGGGLLKLDMREMPYCPICGAQMDGGEAT